MVIMVMKIDEVVGKDVMIKIWNEEGDEVEVGVDVEAGVGVGVGMVTEAGIETVVEVSVQEEGEEREEVRHQNV